MRTLLRIIPITVGLLVLGVVYAPFFFLIQGVLA